MPARFARVLGGREGAVAFMHFFAHVEGDLAGTHCHQVAAALGSLLVMETATIKLTVPASKITASRTITGGQSGRDLTTARIEASVTDTQLGVASADVVPPAYAGGSVSFTCNPCPSTILLWA